MAHERRSKGNAVMMMARVVGVNIAPPTAMITRAEMSQYTLGATAHSAEPTVNSETLTMKILRRPTRSAIRPDGINNAPTTIV